MSKTLEEIILSLKQRISLSIPDLDLNNSEAMDLCVLPQSREFEILYGEAEYIKKTLSVNHASEVSEEDFDAFASNFGIERSSGTKSRTTVRFYRYTIPTVPISIPQGTIVSTRQALTTKGLQFFTLADIQFTDINSLFDPMKGARYVEVAIEAESIGEEYNVAINSINTIISNIRGIDFILNPLAATGGTDKQSNTDMADIVKISNSGSNIGSPAGYEKVILQEKTNIRDVKLITNKDQEMGRNDLPGNLDIYILLKEEEFTTDTIGWIPSVLEYQLSRQPVESIVSITAVDETGSFYTLIQGTSNDYTVEYDYTSDYNRSTKAKTKIKFNPSGPTLIGKSALSVYIQYSYNKAVTDLQSILSSDKYNIIGTDVLVRHAIEKYINFRFDIVPAPGYNTSEVASSIKDTIVRKIGEYKMGQNLQRSDIVSWLYTVTGLDSVNLTTLIPSSDVTCNKIGYLTTTVDRILIS